MTNVYKNFNIKDITVNDQGNYILHIAEPNILLEGSEIYRTITLFSRVRGEKQAQAIERTERTLKEELDDSIIFTDPEDQTEDPNHIYHWVKQHKGFNIPRVSQNNKGYFHLGEPYEGTGRQSRNRVLFSSRYTGVGEYQIDNQYVLAQDALRTLPTLYSHLKEVKEYKQDSYQIRKNNNFAELTFKGQLQRIELNRPYDQEDPQGDNIITRKMLIEDIVACLTNPKDADLVAQLNQLNEHSGYCRILEIIGGETAAFVQDNTSIRRIKGILSQLVTYQLQLVVKPENIDYAIKTSKLRFPRIGYPVNPETGREDWRVKRDLERPFLEYLSGDLCNDDLFQFLLKVPGLSQQDDILPALEELELIENGTVKPLTRFDAYDLFNKLLQNATVEIAVSLTRRGEKIDIDNTNVGTIVRLITAPEKTVKSLENKSSETPTQSGDDQVESVQETLQEEAQPKEENVFTPLGGTPFEINEDDLPF